MDNPWVKLIEFMDRHPVVFVSVLVVAGSVLAVVGIPLPKRTQRQTTEGTETTWSLGGGVPGLGPGLVAIGRAIIKTSEANATERERDRNAHTSAIERIAEEQRKSNAEHARTNENMERFFTAITDLTEKVARLIMLQERAAFGHVPPPSRGSSLAISSSCTPPLPR